MGSPARTRSQRPGSSAWPAALILAAAAAGVAWSWRTWPDPTIDFGRELYVPWRLSQGEVLFRDIVSFNGPLSPYLIAGWFSLAGASLLSLVGLNLVVLGGTLILLYGMLARVASRGAAVLACLSFLALFAFGQLGPSDMLPLGNYNWIAPYSHELTHGIALSLLSLYALFRFASSGRRVWVAGSGLALGLVFLTKAEVFAAALGASAVGLAASLWLARSRLDRSLAVLGLWTAGALLPALISTALLAAAMPFGDALRGTLGTWPHLLDSTHVDLPYFRWGMGTDDLPASLARILLWVGWYAALLVTAEALGGLRLRGRLFAAGVCVGLGALLVTAWLALGWLAWFDERALVQWNEIPQPWPLLLLGTGIAFGVPVLHRKVEPADRPVAALRLALLAFALLLLGKMLLNVRLFHYGFALAAPAACVVVALFWSWIPDWIERRGGGAAVFRGAFLAVWLVAVAAHLWQAHENLRTKVYVVGRGADAFLAPPRGRILSEALEYLERHARPSDTLAALPEGIMLNYLTRRSTSTPFLQYTPPLILLYGEDRMVASLDASPPDWIVLVHRSDAEYGARFFGSDYGSKLRAWILGRYVQVARMGDPPFRGPGFGILILKRRDPA